MFKKDIEFHDLDGNKVVDTFYFNLTSAEVIELEASENEGLSVKLQKIVDNGDRAEILKTFKWLITSTVGVRSQDNKRFEKSPEITAMFMQTEAYSSLFMSLISDEKAASEFINGVFPAELVAQALAATQNTPQVITDMTVVAYGPSLHGMGKIELVTPVEAAGGFSPGAKLVTAADDKDRTEYSRDEMLNMPTDQFNRVFGTNPQKMSHSELVIAMQRRAHGA